MSIPHTVGQIKHGRAGPAGCVLKGIAPHVVPIPHLGIRSRGLKSHLLLTHALPSSCSVSQACSIFFLFALALLLAAGQIKHFRAGPVGCMWNGIAPHVAPIPHLGIRSRGLKSHLLLTLMHSPTLAQYFSDLLFLSLLLGFFLLSFRSSSC